MAAVYTTKGASTATYPVKTGPGGNVCCVESEVYEIASALSANDTIDFFYLPACQVVWGFLAGDDIDTGTEALEIDVGLAANTTYGGTQSAVDPDHFLDSGVISGDAVAGVVPTYASAANFWLPFNAMKDGEKVLDGTKNLIQAKVTAAANAGGTGSLYLVAFYKTAPSA